MPLNETALGRMTLLGARLERRLDEDKSRYAGLRRYFSGPAGQTYELFEWDTSLDGGYVLNLATSRQTASINGAEATLIVLRSNSGKALSILNWDANRRHIELSVNRHVQAEDLQAFIALARSLPLATPARPDAPLPEMNAAPPFGPGPAFPAHPDF